MKKFLAVSLFISTAFFSGIHPVALKKVLVMDFKNTSGDPNYAYLEPSITEAVIKALKKEFVFALFEETEWKALAKKNFFFEDSFHTPTIGMQLGLLGRQDIVIGGGFTISGNQIIAKVHILGMADKKILKSFDVTGYADNRIWDSVNNIANTIATTARDVLPNEKEWSSTAIQGKNQITASAYISPFSFPGARTEPLPSSTAFSIFPNDFSLSFKFTLDYMRYGVFTDNLALWGNFSYIMGNREFDAAGHSPSITVGNFSNTVSGNLSAFQVSAGIGYRILALQSFYVTPRIGAGFFFGTLTMDFSHLTNPPSSLAGNTNVTTLTGDYAGVSAIGDLIIGYQLFEWLTIELLTQYQHIFFAGSDFSSNVSFALNLGVKF